MFLGTTKRVLYKDCVLEIQVHIYERQIRTPQYGTEVLHYLVYLDGKESDEFIRSYLGDTIVEILIGIWTVHLACDPT